MKSETPTSFDDGYGSGQDNSPELGDATGVQCRECLHGADSCRCEIMCCGVCGGPQVYVAEDDITECPACDAQPSGSKPAALYQAGEHPAVKL